MRNAWLTLILLGLSGCTDLVTVAVGAGDVAPVEIEREVPLSPTALPSCPTATLPFTWPGATAAVASIAPRGGGCEVTIAATQAVLVDRATIESQSQSLGDFDETALVGIDLELLELALTNGAGASLDGKVEEASVSVDGQPLFESVKVGAQSPPPRGALPETTVAAFRDALAQPADVRADLEIRLLFADAAAIPKRLGVRIELQPILLVDVVRAAL